MPEKVAWIPSPLPALCQLFWALGQKASGDRAVGVERDVIFAKSREKLCFRKTSDGGIVPLVDGGEDIVVLRGNANHFFDFVGTEIGKPEALELPGLVKFVDSSEDWLQRVDAIRCMDIVNIYLWLLLAEAFCTFRLSKLGGIEDRD